MQVMRATVVAAAGAAAAAAAAGTATPVPPSSWMTAPSSHVEEAKATTNHQATAHGLENMQLMVTRQWLPQVASCSRMSIPSSFGALVGAGEGNSQHTLLAGVQYVVFDTSSA
jgi:hypothetical protein